MKKKIVKCWRIMLEYEDGEVELFDGEDISDEVSKEIDECIEQYHKVSWND